MDNPYQPPAANLVQTTNRQNSLSGFRKFSTWYVFGLSIITLGIYLIYWLYTRTKTLNNLQFVEPIGDMFIKAAVTIYLLDYPIGFSEAFMEQHSEYLLFSNLFSLVSGILMLVWVFMFRSRFNTFLANSPNETSELGPVLTFFFQVLYLSYKINENIELSEATT